MCTCMREKRKILARGKYRLMVMNQNQILFFNIMGANGTDALVKREKKRNSLEEERSADQRYAKTIELEKKDERTRF